MFSFDIFNRAEPFNIYLCKPDESIVCQLNGIDEDTASISIKFYNQYELSFDYNRFINTDNGELIESNGYHRLNIGMKLYVEEIGYFILKYPPMKYNGDIETKTVTAYSIESELEKKDLPNFKINTGEEDSLEYLVSYDIDETEELINAYTGLPYDYIVFYNTFPEQLKELLNKYNDGSTHTNSSEIEELKSYCSLIPRLKSKITTANDGSMSLTEYVEYTYDSLGKNVVSIYLANGFNARISQLITFYTKYRNQLSLITLAIEKCDCNWSIGTIDNSLVNKKFQFNVNGINIYSFLTRDVSEAAKCIFSFNLFNKTINVLLAEKIGKDSGVIIDKYTLMNTLGVSCNDNSVYTRYNVSGGNNIGIQYVNFGISRIDDISYFLNARDENNKRIYVSDELATKYERFVADRNIAREKYIAYTKEYNQCLIDIDAIKYRVPNDSVKNDWDTFTNTELENSLITYNQLLITLESLYKEDYGTVGCNSDGSINENYIKTTEYWYDYCTYQITIEQIKATINARANGLSYSDIDDKEILQIINAYKTEWSLYGTVELQNKINIYTNNMNVLVDSEAIVLKPNSEQAKKWSELSTSEKTEYGNTELNYQYNIYMDLYNEKKSCQEYLNTLLSQLTNLENKLKSIQSNRTTLVKLITLETYDRTALSKIITLPSSNTSGYFTNQDIQIINFLYVDKNYSNENILTTSLDTSVTEIDVQYELLQDAEEQLSIESQPQIMFKSDIDNLLCMPEFKDFDFTIGNYVTVEYYDDYYIDLRLYTLKFNPCIPTDSLSVVFTNYIKSKSERSDISYILKQSINNTSNNLSSGSSNSGGSFGTGDKIDITISNTMLSKLLNTEMFGTRVTNIILDTLKVNSLSAKKATFDGLAKGTTVIDGKCIKTGVIISNNYNGTKKVLSTGVESYMIDNTTGTILNIMDGTFNLGGGQIKYDGKKLTFGSDVTLSWNQILDTDDVALISNVTEITKDTIKTCKISCNQLESGILTLGGKNNGNGELHLLNASGNTIVNLDNNGIVATKGVIGGLTITNEGFQYGSNPFILKYAGDMSVYIGQSGLSVGENDFYVQLHKGYVMFDKKVGSNYQYVAGIYALDSDNSKSVLSFLTSEFISSTSILYSTPLTLSSDGATIQYCTMEQLTVEQNTCCKGNVEIYYDLSVRGTKNRLLKTESFGDRLLYCVESASPIFNDCGEGVINSDGECIISIDSIFLETIDTICEYQVFLQKEGQGDIWVDSKESTFFIVKGTENLKFAWEIRAKQIDYTLERLETPDLSFNNDKGESIGSMINCEFFENDLEIQEEKSKMRKLNNANDSLLSNV